jgi:thiamine pyrophosphate-dependent acetolactate synthase large subunit-like protein
MYAPRKARTAAEALVDQLAINGVQHVFCVPGESYLAVLDALRDRDIAITVCRQEGGAAMMAEAVGKATGRPGICFVTRGPGAANAVAGIHVARQDSTPMTPQPDDVNLGEVMIWLRDHLPDDAILCNGAGNYASWIHRFFRFRHFATQIAPTSASMGYGVPAAVAMQRLHPERTVVSINGDGDFLMNGQEFATAVQYGLPIIVIVCDNGMYGTIRMHQEREYPGRVVATDLRNPDFSAYARAFGGFGASVERSADFPAAFEAAQASRQPAIIHLKISPDAILPATTLSTIRAQALAGA